MINKVKFKLREHIPKTQKGSRVIKVIICFVAAAVVTASIFTAQQSQNKVTTVIKPIKTIEAGSRIRASDLKEIEVGEYGLPAGVISTKEKITGKYAKSDIYPSDFITKERLIEKQKTPFTEMPENRKIMSFTVSNLAASVACNIKSGDIIQVIYSIADPTGMTNETTVYTPESLKRLKVIDIKDANGVVQPGQKNFGQPLPEVGKGNSISSESTESFIPSVVTVYVTDEQAAELYRAEQAKSIYTILVER